MRRAWLGMGALLLLTATVAAHETHLKPRIMLSSAPPAETLGAQLVYYGGAYVPPGTSAGTAAVGTVLGLLIVRGIEDGKARALAEFAAGVKNALSELNVTHELAEAMRSEIEHIAHLKGAVIERVTDATDLEQPGLLVRIEERDIFTIEVRCAFDRQVTSLHLFTSVRLWRKDDPRPLYDGRLHYVSRSFGDEEEARRLWIAENGALLKQAFREGIAETARMFVVDNALRTGLSDLPAETSEATWMAAESGKAAPGTVHVLAQSGERVMGRVKIPAEETVSFPREHAARF